MIRLIFILFFISVSVNASDDETIIQDRLPEFETQSSKPALSPEEIFSRTEAVLNYYKVSPQPDSAGDISDLKNLATAQEIKKNLQWMDPLHFFQRVTNILNNELFVYKDLDSKKNLDFSVLLKPDSFKIFEANKLTPPLKGLRVAIDPGHMGGTFWDLKTGKFVKDSRGHILSEGVINLQTSLLLKVRLEAKGAEVMLTREDLVPVSKADYQKFDLKPIALAELRDSIHANWFLTLIKKSPAGPALFNLFDKSAEVKKIFSESTRSEYFIKREDLWARAKLINDFKPDIVLVIHYDTADPSSNASGVNAKAPRQTKSFIFGAYEQNEFGSTEERKYFVRHLIDQKSWNGSVKLGQAITQSLHTELKLDLDSSPSSEGTKLVTPGIISRNLLVSRMVSAPAVAYLECLFYNRTDEFNELLKPDQTMIIGGKKLSYSNRLVQISDSILAGILEFARQKQVANEAISANN